MCEERIEMRFRPKMQNLGVVCVVYVGKNAKKLPVYVFYS